MCLGASYSEQVKTSEVVQVAVEGVDQLETYFGAYLPQFFYAMLAPLTLFVVLCFVSVPAAVVLLVCVPLIPVAIAAVQTWAKKLLSKYWGQYTALGDTFLENLQGLTTLKIYQADAFKNDEMNVEAEKFRKITMKVLTMQLNSITIMDLIAYGGAALGVIMAATQLRAGKIDLAGALLIVLLAADFFIPMRQLGSFFHIKDAAISAVKGFMAVGCFTLVPVELYKLSVTLQASLTSGITGYGESFDALSTDIINSLQGVDIGAAASSGVFDGIGSITSPIMVIFIIIMMGYAVIKCFFSNLKRGGVLLIQIAVGSLYMFSVPRGYMDGFVQWCKQIIGLCLTTFLQATILTAGLLVLKDHALLGLGLMLSAGEVPRICGAFGLDTSTRANIMSAVYAAQSAVNTTRTVVQAVGAAK